jgi:hypothetical protein
VNSVIDVVQIQYPVSALGCAEPLGLDDELPAASLRISFLAVQINPLKIGALSRNEPLGLFRPFRYRQGIHRLRIVMRGQASPSRGRNHRLF